WALRRFFAFWRGDAASAFCSAFSEPFTSCMNLFFFLIPPSAWAGVPWTSSARRFIRQRAYDAGSDPFWHPSTGSQVWVGHASPLPQFGGVPLTHPVAGSHVSTPLQTLLSVHCTGVPVQVPLLQTPPVTHFEPASHVPPVVGVWAQPLFGSQESSVQG